MAFSTITFKGAVSGTVSAGIGLLVSTGTLTLTVSGGDSGAVTGTWSFVGSYDNNNPYYPSSGIANVSGTVSGTGGASGPWALTLTNGESNGLTLSYANGQWSLDGQAGFEITYKVTGGYDSEFTYHDHYRLGTNLDVAGSGPGDSGAGATDGPDSILGTAGNDAISAQAGNDTVTGGTGNDTVDGGSGVDTAVFSGARANYTISHGGSTWTVSGTDGVDTLVNVERLVFADEKIAIDISGNGGQAYRLYKAAFDRVPDLAGLGYQMNELDKGFSLAQVATAFIASPEFQSLYGTAVDDTAFVTLLYRNVLDREPEAAGLAYHLNDLAHGVTRAQILANFSESPENQANVIGLVDAGMVYVL